MIKEIIIPIRTPVAIMPKDWSELIDRRAVFSPIYGVVVNYSVKTVIVDNLEQTVYATDVQLKNGNVTSIAGFKYENTGIFDKDGFTELIREEIQEIDETVKELQTETKDTEAFVGRIPEKAEFIRAFWEARLASLKQSIKFLNKKKGKLEDLGKKVSRKLEKMNK